MLLNQSVLNTVTLNGDGVAGGSGGGAGGFGGSLIRFISGADLDFLQNAAGYAVYARVRIADPSGVLYDYENRNGINWIKSVAYEGTIDAPIATATVKLWRSVGSRSLAPLKTDSSYNQLPFVLADLSQGTGPSLDAGRRILIDTASIALGSTPEDEDWHTVFDGYIDTIDWNQNPIVIDARDLGADLNDTWFPTTNVISPDPANIQGALAELLDLAHLDVFTTLYVPFAPDPEVVVGSFRYDIEPVMDALQRVAQINGWDLRYRWSDADQMFRFTFKDPGRGRSVPDFFFTAAQYIDFKKLAIDRTPIRNDVTIWYGPAESRAFVNHYSPESVRRYHRRSMVLQEASDSPIQTADQALYMAQLIVYDIAEPLADLEVEMFYFWPIELHNVCRFFPNGVHSDTDLDLAVVGYRHAIEADGTARTILTMRGKPAGSYWNWLGRRPSAPGINPDTPTDSPAAFSSLTQVPDYASDHVQLLWTWGGDPSATFTVYAWTGNGGAPAGVDVGTDTSLDYIVGTNIEPFDPVNPSLPIYVSFYVQAIVGGLVAATSLISSQSYGFAL